jgi:diaminopimelate decarboxylase
VYLRDELQWEGASLADLADRLGTPAFLFSDERLRRNCQDLKAAFPDATLRYCAKTNNELSVLRLVAAEGLQVLASHVAEVDLAIAAGFDADRIAFQRPVLIEAELRQVLQRGVRFVHLLRYSDIEILERAAAGLGVTVRISIRRRHRGGLPLMSGAAERLGCSDDEVFAAAGRIGTSPSLRLAALNIYLGTQQAGPGSFEKAIASSLSLARRLPVRPLEINLGGGIPSPGTQKLAYRSMLHRLRGTNPGPGMAVRQFAEAVARAWRWATAGDGEFTLALEPGRSVLADSSVLLTRVLARQDDWLFVDASRNYSGEAPLLFTRAILPVRRIKGKEQRFSLSGSTLNTLDVIDVRRLLPEGVGPGDVLALFDAGAYSLSRATRYAGLAPATYMIDGSGAVSLVRRAGNLRRPRRSDGLNHG